MALKDFFTAEGREAGRIRRATKTLLERYAQHDARMEAVDKLRGIGTDEALYGLSRRFSATSENLGTDQDEKKYVRDLLVAEGEKSIAPLKRYIKGHDKVTWAIDALGELLPGDRLIPFLQELLQGGDPVLIRGDKAVQILSAMADSHDPAVVPAIVDCLESDDDTVRFAAVECLETFGDESARVPFLERLVNDDEDSQRVRARIAQALMKLGWDVKGFRKKVEERLPEPYRLNAKGRITE